MEISFVIGIIAGTFTCIAMFPQAVKIIQEKKAKDVSLVMPIVLLVGHALWITYGVLKKDIPIVAPNCIALTLDMLMIFLTIKYGEKSKK